MSDEKKVSNKVAAIRFRRSEIIKEIKAEILHPSTYDGSLPTARALLIKAAASLIEAIERMGAEAEKAS